MTWKWIICAIKGHRDYRKFTPQFNEGEWVVYFCERCERPDVVRRLANVSYPINRAVPAVALQRCACND